jgi:hypothetical protein
MILYTEPFRTLILSMLILIFSFCGKRLTVSGDNLDVIFSSEAKQNFSAYLDGQAYIRIPIDVDPNDLPLITFGAWVKPEGSNHQPGDTRFAYLNIETILS